MTHKEQLIENALDYLEFSEMEKCSGNKFHNFDLNEFKRAEIISKDIQFCDDDWGIFDDVKPQDISKDFDISIITPGKPERGKEWDYAYFLSRIQRIYPKEVRGKVIAIFPYMALLYLSILEHNRKFITSRKIIGYNGTEWRDISHGRYDQFDRRTMNRLNEEDKDNIMILMGIGFTRRYYWNVSLGYSLNGPSISFSTNPKVIREMFKLRDIPPGKNRREALRNWVRDHWRKKTVDPEDDIYIRTHLRGQTDFQWNGVFVKIFPSEHDLELNQGKLK